MKLASKKTPVKKSVKKKAVKKTVKKKAVKKTVKKKIKTAVKSTKAQEELIRAKLKEMEAKLIDNYRVLVEASGKDWKKERAVYEKKVKARLRDAEKTIRAKIKKDPESAALAAAAIGTIIGAIAVGLVKRRK